MQNELKGSVPKVPFAYTKTLINRAWKTVREANLWSFNLFESAWITPPPISSGTATVTQGDTFVYFDGTATSALIAGTTLYSSITQRQFRNGVGGIYNIIAFDPTSGVAQLDRMYADPSLSAGTYNVYQAYYTPPMLDFLTWISVKNPIMFLNLGLDMNRAQVDARDPQRSWYQFPTEVVPYATDTRGAGTENQSGTYGYMMFELWGQAITPFTYQCYGVRRGQDLTDPTDTLPVEIGEDVVLAKARQYAYEWCEANKDMLPRSAGPDFRFLMGKTEDEYKKRLIEYRKNDKEKVDNWFSSRSILWSGRAFGYYNTIASVAGPYAQQ